ncbi:MAG: TIR domain-containing protein [Phototrophicaceae bacterium]
MADIFVSYSRQDEAFGRTLHARLTGLKRDVWMDWEDIPFNSDWWQEIRRGIETSDNFLIILSNDFVRSPVCMLEVDYARQNNKRILVVAHNFHEREDVSDQLRQRTQASETLQQLLGDRDIVNLSTENWTTIGHVNWLFFNDETKFDENFHNLLKTLDTDLNHVRTHTNLQVRALEWFTNDRNWSFLITGVLIDQAEEWLYAADTENKVPVPTFVQREFIKESRQQQLQQEKQIEDMQTRAKRFRQASIVAGAIAAVMIIIAIGLSVVTGRVASQAQQDLNTAQAQVNFADEQIVLAEEQVALAEEQVAAANIVASEAVGTLTMIPPTFEAIQRDIDSNNTQVASVGETLTPIASTLESAENARQSAQSLAADAQTQVVNANNSLANANTTLTPISLTLTQSSDAQATANSLVVLSNAELTQIAPTLSQASTQVVSASTQIADAENQVANAAIQVADASTQVASANTQVADVDNQIATADERNVQLASTAEAIRAIAESNRLQAQSQALIVSAEQASVNGDIDLALALILESYDIDPNLPQTRRLLNSIAYTSARFILRDVSFVTFDSDSSMIAYGIDNEVVIVDIESRQEIVRLTGHTERVVDGAFSATDNLFVSGSVDTNVITWNTDTWTVERVLTTHENPITDIAFDLQGRRIGAVANNDVAIVWDVPDNYREMIYEFDNPDTSLTQIAFYANGLRFLAWGQAGSVPVQYRVNTTSNQPPTRHLDRIFTVLNSASQEGQTVRKAMIEDEFFLDIYDLVQPSTVISFVTGFNWNTGEDVVGARAFNSSGSEVVFSIENQREQTNDIILMNTAQRERRSGLTFQGDATQRVTALAYSPDEQTILSGFGSYLVLWDAQTGRELRRFGAHLDDIIRITYSPDSKYAITQSRDGNYRVWDVSFSDPAVSNRISIPNNSGTPPTNPGLSPDNSELYFNIASDIYRYNTQRGRRIRDTFSFFGLQDVLYSRVNAYIVTIAADTTTVDPNARMWDMSSNSPSLWQDELRPDVDGVIDPVGTFSADGRQIALSMTTFIRVYDVTNPNIPVLTHEFDRRGMDIGAVIFSPDGRYLYAAVNQLDGVEAYAIVTWDLLEDTMISPIPIPHVRPITSMDVSADNNRIITASADHSIILYDLQANTILRRMLGHRGSVNRVYFGENDDVALSASDDSTLILWDLETGQLIRQYTVGNPISGLYLSNDHTLAVSTDTTNFVTVWRIESLDDVVEWVVDNRALLPLTDEQCRQFEIECDGYDGVDDTRTLR